MFRILFLLCLAVFAVFAQSDAPIYAYCQSPAGPESCRKVRPMPHGFSQKKRWEFNWDDQECHEFSWDYSCTIEQKANNFIDYASCKSECGGYA